MKKVIEFNQKCQSCDGTGLYTGMGEQGGAAVVCSKCKGTGCFKFHHEYEEFTSRVPRTDVKRVFKINPGICVGEGDGIKLEDFGGIPYKDWDAGKPFQKGHEMRKYTCPAWWYQCDNYSKKPNWRECIRCGTFTNCKHYTDKASCWLRFDVEQKGE